MSNSDVDRWLASADEDLKAAELLSAAGILGLACFHCQQAAEKALKGLLMARSGTYPKSHSLEQLVLMGGVTKDERRAWRAACQRLDEFYLPFRYPDAAPADSAGEPTPEDVSEALTAAKKIVDEVQRAVGQDK